MSGCYEPLMRLPKNYCRGKPSNMSLRDILRNKVNLDSLINSLLLIIFRRGGVEVVCLRLLSSLKQLTRNRLKPVQTGRFHLGLVFSRWRRVKFGLGETPTAPRDWPRRRPRLPTGRPIAPRSCQSISIRLSARPTAPPEEKKRADSRAEWTRT